MWGLTLKSDTGVPEFWHHVGASSEYQTLLAFGPLHTYSLAAYLLQPLVPFILTTLLPISPSPPYFLLACFPFLLPSSLPSF